MVPTETKERDQGFTTVLALNWGCSVCPETTSALPDLVPYLPQLREAGAGTLVGHGHPRARAVFERFYGRAGIPYRAELEALPDLALVDNSSIGWEWAALGVPVVWIQARAYRDVPHGLRFGGTSEMPRIAPSDLADYLGILLTVGVLRARLIEASVAAGRSAYDDLVDGRASERAVAEIMAML